MILIALALFVLAALVYGCTCEPRFGLEAQPSWLHDEELRIAVGRDR